MNVVMNKHRNLITNESLIFELSKFDLNIDDYGRIYTKGNANHRKFSFYAGDLDFSELVELSKNFSGWIFGDSILGDVYFKLSSISSMIYDKGYEIGIILNSILNLDLNEIVEFINSNEVFRMVYCFGFNELTKRELYFKKIVLLNIIKYLVLNEEHGSLIYIKDNEYRLLHIQDGEVFFQTNNYSVLNNEIFNNLKSLNTLEFREWVWKI